MTTCTAGSTIIPCPPTVWGRIWKFKKVERDEWVRAAGAAERNKKDSSK